MFPSLVDLAPLNLAYRAADTSSDGLIQWAEFGTLLKYLVFFNNLFHDFQIADVNGDRVVDLAEFVEHATTFRGLTPEEAESEFESLEQTPPIGVSLLSIQPPLESSNQSEFESGPNTCACSP
jgi:hypothetical protein